jgi:hypothetical protein
MVERNTFHQQIKVDMAAHAESQYTGPVEVPPRSTVYRMLSAINFSLEIVCTKNCGTSFTQKQGVITMTCISLGWKGVFLRWKLRWKSLLQTTSQMQNRYASLVEAILFAPQ